MIEHISLAKENEKTRTCWDLRSKVVAAISSLRFKWDINSCTQRRIYKLSNEIKSLIEQNGQGKTCVGDELLRGNEDEEIWIQIKTAIVYI